ncbi:AAA family ATPase [Sphingomonas phyllosphaerae]|uniref:AAA family ATPase n=1 Tax=Sphingomonas phyllosphaerae TaxID=257003 RepID=UPI0003B3058A|nr:AAA family ATPase [Sphingomonas phyllosphaerae]
MPTLPDEFDTLLGACMTASPHDQPITITTFSDVHATAQTVVTSSVRNFIGGFSSRTAKNKAALPLFKMAQFGDAATDRGSLRHDDNIVAISGIVADYDAGEISISEAAAMARAAGIAVAFVGSPSHSAAKPRWRAVAPLAELVSPDEHARMCARLNGALGGALASESFTTSQSYFYGRLDGAPELEVAIVDGQPLDRAIDLDAKALGRDGRPFNGFAATRAADEQQEPFEAARAESALAAIPATNADDPATGGRDLWLNLGMALFHGSCGSDEGFALWDAWSKRGAKYGGERDQRRKWRSFGRAGAKRSIGLGTLYRTAAQYGWEPPETAARKEAIESAIADLDDLDPLADPAEALLRPNRLRFFNPAECAAEPSRGYIVKGLMAPGDVGCIYGAPGAGKSLISPHIGYAVARGVPAFGMRTKPGLVLYVAAEDARGMKDRVRALRIRHGDADAFRVGEGITDLLTTGSEDLVELRRHVRELQPSLIFIDTLAMAFPGLEENSAEGMGRVMAAAHSLTKPSNAAVVLVHHDTKAQTPTPRGHSLLNGALDFALQLFPKDESGVVRGRLSKNRNGACDRDIAFRIDTEQLGVDEDGDPITAALVAELTLGAAAQRVKLSPSEAAARRHLSGLQVDTNGSACEREWREACINGRAVSGSDNADSRRRVVDRAVASLVRKGAVTIRDGRVFPDNGASYQHDDLEP